MPKIDPFRTAFGLQFSAPMRSCLILLFSLALSPQLNAQVDFNANARSIHLAEKKSTSEASFSLAQQIHWETAPQVLEDQTPIRVEIAVEGTTQVLYGRFLKLSGDEYPSTLSLLSSENVLHAIDTANLGGRVYVLPGSTDLSSLHSHIELPWLQGKSQRPKVSNDRAQKLLSKYFLRTDKKIFDLMDRITTRLTWASVATLGAYLFMWDSAFSPWEGSLRPPEFVDHASSAILSAVPLSFLQLRKFARSANQVKPKKTLLYFTTALLVWTHSTLEIKDYGASWSQFIGPNVPDMGDFYAGVGTALIIALGPDAMTGLLSRAKKNRILKSLVSCSALLKPNPEP